MSKKKEFFVFYICAPYVTMYRVNNNEGVIMRYTKNEIILSFARFAKLMGRKIGKEIGDWQLDCASCYGGYVIEECMESGGIDHPLGSRRRTASEMYLSLHMAINAIETLNYKKGEQ